MDYTKWVMEIIIFILLPQGVLCDDKALLGLIASSVVAGVFFILIVVMAIMVTIWEDLEVAKSKYRLSRHRYNRFRVHTPDSSATTDHTIEITPKLWAGVPATWIESEPIPGYPNLAEDQVEREFYFTHGTPPERQQDPPTVVVKDADAHSHRHEYHESRNRISGSTNQLSASTNRISGVTGQTTLPSSGRYSNGAYAATRLSNSNLSHAHSEVIMVPGREMTALDDGRGGSVPTLDRMTGTDEKVTSF